MYDFMTVVRIRLSLSFIIVCRVFEHVLTLFVEHYIQPAKNPTLPQTLGRSLPNGPHLLWWLQIQFDCFQLPFNLDASST